MLPPKTKTGKDVHSHHYCTISTGDSTLFNGGGGGGGGWGVEGRKIKIRNKKHINWKGKNKMVIIHRQHDFVHRKS